MDNFVKKYDFAFVFEFIRKNYSITNDTINDTIMIQ